jgi:hypothetical protein
MCRVQSAGQLSITADHHNERASSVDNTTVLVNVMTAKIITEAVHTAARALVRAAAVRADQVVSKVVVDAVRKVVAGSVAVAAAVVARSVRGGIDTAIGCVDQTAQRVVVGAVQRAIETLVIVVVVVKSDITDTAHDVVDSDNTDAKSAEDRAKDDGQQGDASTATTATHHVAHERVASVEEVSPLYVTESITGGKAAVDTAVDIDAENERLRAAAQAEEDYWRAAAEEAEAEVERFRLEMETALERRRSSNASVASAVAYERRRSSNASVASAVAHERRRTSNAPSMSQPQEKESSAAEDAVVSVAATEDKAGDEVESCAAFDLPVATTTTGTAAQESRGTGQLVAFRAAAWGEVGIGSNASAMYLRTTTNASNDKSDTPKHATCGPTTSSMRVPTALTHNSNATAHNVPDNSANNMPRIWAQQIRDAAERVAHYRAMTPLARLKGVSPVEATASSPDRSRATATTMTTMPSETASRVSVTELVQKVNGTTPAKQSEASLCRAVTRDSSCGAAPARGFPSESEPRGASASQKHSNDDDDEDEDETTLQWWATSSCWRSALERSRSSNAAALERRRTSNSSTAIERRRSSNASVAELQLQEEDPEVKYAHMPKWKRDLMIRKHHRRA